MIGRSEENKFINDTIDEKRNSRFLIETSSNMTYIYHAICRYTLFSTISKHLPFNPISTKIFSSTGFKSRVRIPRWTNTKPR